MIKEIYIKDPKDPNYNLSILEHSDPIEIIISKIKMVLGTVPGKVLGDFKFGIDIESLIFQTNINKSELEQKIKEQIHAYVSESSTFNISVNVEFGKKEYYDFAIINIYINGQKTIGFLIS